MRKIAVMLLLFASACFGELNVADFPNFKAAVQACIDRNENTLFVPRMKTSAFVLKEALPAWPGGNLIIRGEGDPSIIWLEGDGVICIPGCSLKLRDLRVYGAPTNSPKAGVVFCRAESGDRKGHSVPGCQLRDVTINGSYTVAGYVNLCAEGEMLIGGSVVNDKGYAAIWDSNDRYGLGRTTDAPSFTNSHHTIVGAGFACWNRTSNPNLSPILIAGHTDSLVMDGVYVTAQGCKAYVTLWSYPASFGRGNRPRWNTIRTAGWESAPNKQPYYGIWYKCEGGQVLPEKLKSLPAIRWQTGPAEGQETVP